MVASLIFAIKVSLLSIQLYGSSGTYSQSYIVVCAVRGGQMIDQGPLRGCFIKDKDGTFYIMESDFSRPKEEDDLCENCVY